MKIQLLFNRISSTVFLLAISFFLLPFALLAQFTGEVNLGQYSFAGESGSGSQELNASNTTPHAIFSKFKRVGLTATSGSNVFNSTGWSTGAIDTTQYLEFTVSAGPDYRVHITGVSSEGEINADGPLNIRIASNNGSKKFNLNSYEPPQGTHNINWDGGDVIIDRNESLTFRIYGYNARDESGSFSVDNVTITGTLIPDIRFNEFHYAANDATNPDFIEVIVPKSFTALAAVTLTLYEDTDGDGFGDQYGTPTLLSDFLSLPESSYDNYDVYYLNIPEGMAEIGGFSLTTQTDLIQFLSYGTAETNGIIALNGPAAMGAPRSVDVGETEDDSDGTGNSIFLPEGPFQVWINNEDGVNTKGLRNGENIILPVELVYFKSNKTSQGVLLSWATATEKDNDYFLVERSNSSEKGFTPIAKIMGKGTTLAKQTYQALDEKVITGTAYYRLKQVDYDGKFAYSRIIAVNGQPEQLAVYPNPATTSINIAFTNSKTNALALQIFNNLGQLVHQENIVSNNVAQNKELSLAHLSAGTYLVILLDGGNRYSKKFIKL